MQYTLYKESSAGWVLVKELDNFDEATYIPEEGFRVERYNPEGYHTIIAELPASPTEEDVLTPETLSYEPIQSPVSELPVEDQPTSSTFWDKVKSLLLTH